MARMMQITMSPGAKPGAHEALIDPGTGNPFIEKSDIAKHQKRILKIATRMDNIQNLYQNETTKAQHEEILKNNREKYFD